MNFKSFLSATLMLLTVSILSAQGISFEKGSWDEVVKKAKAENKYIFVDAYAEWCGPCKRMAKEVFTENSVGSYFNKNFVCYKFDMEKGEGPKFAKTYTVAAYPTLLFFNPSGELIHKAVGGRDSETFVTLGEDAMNPEKQVFTMKKKFEAGEKSQEFLISYIDALLNASEDANEATELYFNAVPKEDWTSMDNFMLIYKTQASLDSKMFNYVLANRALYEKSVGKEYVDYMIDEVYNKEISRVSEEKDQVAADELKLNMKKNLGSNAESMIAFLDLNYNMGTENEFKYAQIFFDKFCENSAQLNSFAWYYFENETDKTKLKAALKWAEKSIKLDKNWQNLDTRANLHFVLGNKKAALADAKEAVKMANNIGDDASATESLIKKIKIMR
jgi:thioredoxin-related protein